MSAEHEPEDPDIPDENELQRMLRDMLSGGPVPEGTLSPEQLAEAAGITDQASFQRLFSTLRQAMNQPQDGIDWSVTRSTAIDVAQEQGAHHDPAPAERAFPVAAIWLDEVTDIGATPEAPRTLSRVEWVQQSVDTWISLAEPVAESISRALVHAMESQMPEEMRDSLQGAAPMLRSVGGALFAVQLGTIVGRISTEVVSAGDIGIPLLSGPGREGGALLPSGVAAFADGLDQDADAVTLYLAIRELAYARLFRHAKWLRLHLLTAITDYARGIHIDTDRLESLTIDLDLQEPSELQSLLTSGALIPPRTEAQEAAHLRLETMLALIEGWVDVVTGEAASRIPGAEAIAEMVRRRRATGGPAEHAFAALAGLELRPRRLREAASLWKLVADQSDVGTRDSLWAHPDVLPTSEELDAPERVLERLGLKDSPNDDEAQEFDVALQQLLDGTLPPAGPSEEANDEDPEAPSA